MFKYLGDLSYISMVGMGMGAIFPYIERSHSKLWKELVGREGQSCKKRNGVYATGGGQEYRSVS